MVAFAAVFAGTTTGALFGLVSASLGGKFDLGVQRVLDVLQAFPDLTLALLLAAALGPGLDTVIIAIAATKIPFGGRVIRSVALQIREMDYVTAARSIGASHIRIMRLHIAPQCVASFLVLATTHLGVAIVIEAALGFLGVGIAPPTPTWGNMLAMQSNTLIPSCGWWSTLGQPYHWLCWHSACLATALGITWIPGCGAVYKPLLRSNCGFLAQGFQVGGGFPRQTPGN